MVKDNWIQTFTGKKFYPLEPRPEDIEIEDIAHALSLICRFGGHCKNHYSVAKHSIWVSELCPKDALSGLLHDASEAYLMDVPRPIKPLLKEYKKMELEVQSVIYKRFGLEPEISDEVHKADVQMLKFEKDFFMLDTHHRHQELPETEEIDEYTKKRIVFSFEKQDPLGFDKLWFLKKFKDLI